MTAEVAVTEPPTGVILRGTVVFGTGGGGNGFYEADPVARAMMLRLSAGGWRLVQRGWDGFLAGWITGPGGMLAVSNRYASLLTWIHSTIHSSDATKPFCATGNSGGSSELSYALARWGGGDLLDLAIPTSGPPIVALDHFCLDGADSSWLAECGAALPAAALFPQVSTSWCSYWSQPDGGTSMGPRAAVDSAYTPATPCGSHDATARAQLLADSAVAPGAVFDYPLTKVDSLFGLLDIGEAVAGGHYYASKITSLHSVQYVAMTGHPLFSTDAGAAAIESAINTDCVARH
jgi:hypothetical protein